MTNVFSWNTPGIPSGTYPDLVLRECDTDARTENGVPIFEKGHRSRWEIVLRDARSHAIGEVVAAFVLTASSIVRRGQVVDLWAVALVSEDSRRFVAANLDRLQAEDLVRDAFSHFREFGKIPS